MFFLSVLSVFSKETRWFSCLHLVVVSIFLVLFDVCLSIFFFPIKTKQKGHGKMKTKPKTAEINKKQLDNLLFQSAHLCSQIVPEYCWISQLVSGMVQKRGPSVFPIALPTVLGDDLRLSPSTVGSSDWFQEWLRKDARRFSRSLFQPYSETPATTTRKIDCNSTQLRRAPYLDGGNGALAIGFYSRDQFWGLENTIFIGLLEPQKWPPLKHDYWSTISPFTALAGFVLQKRGRGFWHV